MTCKTCKFFDMFEGLTHLEELRRVREILEMEMDTSELIRMAKKATHWAMELSDANLGCAYMAADKLAEELWLAVECRGVDVDEANAGREDE